MLAAGSTTWADQILNSATMKAGANSNTDWNSYLGGSNDDSQVIQLVLRNPLLIAIYSGSYWPFTRWLII